MAHSIIVYNRKIYDYDDYLDSQMPLNTINWFDVCLWAICKRY